MANDLNSCDFIGRLGADPETRFTPNGNAVTNIRIACGESWKNRDTGQKEERTEWVPVVMFGKIAEIAGQYLKKGSRVFIRGKFKTRKWTNKEGQDVYTTEVVVDINGQMQMLDSKPEGGQAPQNRAPAQQAANQPAQYQQNNPAPTGAGGGYDDFSDDIPFDRLHWMHGG